MYTEFRLELPVGTKLVMQSMRITMVAGYLCVATSLFLFVLALVKRRDYFFPAGILLAFVAAFGCIRFVFLVLPFLSCVTSIGIKQ